MIKKKNNLEEMMKKDGWVLGYTENWGVKYWSFRKGDFEISVDDIFMIDKDDRDVRYYKKWKEDNK